MIKPSYNEIPFGYTEGTNDPLGGVGTFAATSATFNWEGLTTGQVCARSGLSVGGINFVCNTDITIGPKCAIAFGVLHPIDVEIRQGIFVSGKFLGIASAAGLKVYAAVFGARDGSAFGNTPETQDVFNILPSVGTAVHNNNLFTECDFAAPLRPRLPYQSMAPTGLGPISAFVVLNTAAANVVLQSFKASIEATVFDRPDIDLLAVQ